MQLNLNTKLTLKQFIKLFNDLNDEGNEFYDQFYLRVFDETNNELSQSQWDRVEIVPRNHCKIY